MTAPPGGKPVYAPITGRGRRRRLDAECWHEGCERPRASMFYCQTHYRRWRKGADMSAPIKRGAVKKYGDTCSADGCERPAPAAKYCQSHLRRIKAGNPHKPVRRYRSAAAPCATWGCTKPRRSIKWCIACYARRRRGLIRYGWRQWPARWHQSDPLFRSLSLIQPREGRPLLDAALAGVLSPGPSPPAPLPKGEGRPAGVDA